MRYEDPPEPLTGGDPEPQWLEKGAATEGAQAEDEEGGSGWRRRWRTPSLTPTPFDSLPSPLDAVRTTSRFAARWTLAAAAGIGAVLISGGPLVAVGKSMAYCTLSSPA